LQFRKLPAFPAVIGQFVIGKFSSWNNVGSHELQSGLWCYDKLIIRIPNAFPKVVSPTFRKRR
jgi:hypothetical protein